METKTRTRSAVFTRRSALAPWLLGYPNVGHTHDSNSVVANPRASSASSFSSSTHLDSVSATTFSDPFRCAIWKSKLCNLSDHRARRPLRSFMVISHFRLAWSVMTVNCISST
ncbi:uncharacterized protein LOC122622000 [Drosophila teissieri]|uniref:uncharacterized protein LOC122622000 n=1 Tax=Drosophila teissieri TaxID=7243 RepID=UPI001CB9EB74|nr:uncharacterized protein LOC122622000 [Drosophila teissieri]